MAVLPGMAGQGCHAPQPCGTGRRRLRQSALVSVQGSRLLAAAWLWAQPLHQPEQQQRLASYGEGAVYMARTLQAI